jgi:alkylation response protein AidB-like acyl-CoA dehydrogenase
MDFTVSPQHELFRRTVAAFVEQEVIPRVSEMEERREIPIEFYRRMGELGYFGLRYPEKYGGAGADALMFAIFLEEMARGYLSLAAAAMMQCLMGTNFIYRFGTEAQRERLLVPAIRGEAIGTIAMTEPGAGSDLGAITTRAVREGDSYILDGTKTWITSARRADFFTVAAKTNPDPKAGHKGLSLFLVEKPSHPGHDFEYTQPEGGRMSGRAIATIGYRGMAKGFISRWRALPVDGFKPPPAPSV